MINISKSGNAIKFVFTDSDHYLYGNGEIEVPVNSLSLIVDESNMVTFRKANSNDIFLSFNPANSNLSDKEGVINFYKTDMVGSTGGGGSESGITSGDVQTMIDESLEDYYDKDEIDSGFSTVNQALSGKADTTAVTAVNNALTAHTSDTTIHVTSADKTAWNGKADTSAVTAVANDVSTLSGQVATKVATTDFSAYSAATDARIAEDEEVTAAALNDLQENKADTSAVTAAIDAAISGKADTSAVTAVNDALTAHTSDTGIHVTQADKTSWNAKAEPYSAGTGIEISGNVISVSGMQETLVSGTNIKTINNESILGSGNITISGGGGQSLVYYTEDTSNESATIMVQNDDGLGNRSENRVFVDGGDIIIESYNETDDGEGNTGTTDTQVDINSLGLSIITSSDDGIDTNQTELEVQPMGAYINSEPIATEPYVNAALSGKVDTSAITSSITSGSTDSEIPTAKAVYDAIPTGGGGATYSAGTNISIDTANTISCTLNLSNGTGGHSLVSNGSSNTATKESTFSFGQNLTSSRMYGVSFGLKNVFSESGSQYTFGESGNTLFSIGNGNRNGGQYHNALDIRQNGDIYFPDTDNTTYQNFYEKPMVRLQDMYGALGGLKLVKCTQAEYDALVSGGTVDANTLYIINNVV